MKVMSNTNTQQQQLDRAKAIVDRYRQRGNVLPRELSKHKRVEPEKLQGILVIVLNNNEVYIFYVVDCVMYFLRYV